MVGQTVQSPVAVFLGVSLAYLLDLERVALIRAGDVVGERLRAGEVVVGGGGCHDVAVARELAGEASHGAGNLVDLGEEDDARKFTGMCECVWCAGESGERGGAGVLTLWDSRRWWDGKGRSLAKVSEYGYL